MNVDAASETVFPASQLARAAGVSKRALLAELQSVAPRGTILVSGNPAPAWSLADLPAPRREAILRAAQSTGHRGAAAFITAVASPWRPPVALSEIADAAIHKAANLRRAMARVLELRNNPSVSGAELESVGLADYRNVFGFAITGRTFRALLKRTVARDNFAENWSRLEIYLDGNPQRKTNAAAAAPMLTAPQFPELHDLMATFKDAAKPSTREREAFWLSALHAYESQIDTGQNPKRARVALVNYLWSAAPWLAKSKNSLRVTFAAKYDRWLEKERGLSALRDGREAKRGIPTAPPIAQEAVDAVVGRALLATGGRISQAAREVAAMAAEYGITPELAKLLKSKACGKSHINPRLREAVSHQVEMLKPHRLGRLALDTARAWVDRDYSNTAAGACFNADDFTLPVIWYLPDGNGWFNLVRGQCLVVIDFRTLRILGFSLQPDRNYNSSVIHTLFTRVFSDWGVPEILYLERGIWKESKLITGGAKARRVPAGWQFLPLSFAEMQGGFGDLGVRFIHATRARSKLVERVGGLFQDLMEAEPGYCGREARHDQPEDCKRQQEDVQFHRVHPSKYFYDGNQWEARLAEIFTAYNAIPQEGKILAGLSPDEAQEKLQDAAHAPMLFDARSRHLLAHYRVPVSVGNNGITIRIGKKSFVYRNEQTGRDKGQTRLAWFNPDEPDILSVTDMNQRNPYSVELSNSVDALNPDPEAYAAELARIEAHESYGKTRYRTLKSKFAPLFRRVIPNRATVETGLEMRQQREVIQSQKQSEDSRRRKVFRRANELRLPSSILNATPEADEGTRLMLEAKRAHERGQAQTTENPL